MAFGGAWLCRFVPDCGENSVFSACQDQCGRHVARQGHRIYPGLFFQIFAAPGNPGMAKDATCLDIGTGNLDALEAAAIQHAVDLVVVGPEAPLVAGLADRLRA